MNPLPNLFLADLGPELVLTPKTVREACQTVRRNREAWLTQLRTRQIAEIIGYTAEQWLDPQNGLRLRALAEAPAQIGVSSTTLARGLDHFLRQLTPENLEGLVAQDLGDTRRLDEFTGGPIELRTGRTAIARRPELLGHITAGNLPIPALQSITLGLLLRSAQFIKCASGASLLPRLFAHSLALTEPRIGSCLELAEWPRGAADLEEAFFSEVQCLTATGSDAMLEDVRRRVPLHIRFVGYGHRVSFAYVTSDMLTTYSVKRVIRDLASDVTAWNQLGCLSPHVVYVQDDGVHSPESIAEMLAEELARREIEDPRGDIPVAEAAEIASRRTIYQMRAGKSLDTVEKLQVDTAFRDMPGGVRIWESPGSTAWTVVYDNDPRFEFSCLNRFIYVKPVHQLAEVLRYAEPIRHQVSTVAVAALDHRLTDLARDLARWGVARVCPIGRMQEPPLAWRHDGRPTLGDLIQWTDLESP
jgi:hypothetical protein